MKAKTRRKVTEVDRLHTRNNGNHRSSSSSKPDLKLVTTPVTQVSNSTKKFYHCPFCAESKAGFDAFIAHVKRHLDIAVHVCLECRRGFLAYEAFVEHEADCNVAKEAKCSTRAKVAKTVRVSTVAPVKQFLFCADCGQIMCEITPSTLPLIASLVSSNAEIEAVKQTQRFRKVTIFAEQAKFNREFEKRNANDDPVAFAVCYVSHSKSLPTKCLLCTEQGIEVRFNSPQEILNHCSAHDMASNSDSSQNFSSSHGFTCEKCSSNWPLAIAFHDHVLNSCPNDYNYSDSQYDSMRDFFVSTPSIKAAVPKRSVQNEELDCDVCGDTYTVATFNNHDCATSHTRRLLVDDVIVKCPSVTPIPCSVVLGTSNELPDLTIPKILLNWLSKVVIFKVSPKEQRYSTAVSCSCVVVNSLVCNKNSGVVAKNQPANVDHAEFSACAAEHNENNTDCVSLIKRKRLFIPSSSCSSEADIQEHSSKLAGVGDEFALIYETINHELYGLEGAQPETVSVRSAAVAAVKFSPANAPHDISSLSVQQQRLSGSSSACDDNNDSASIGPINDDDTQRTPMIISTYSLAGQVNSFNNNNTCLISGDAIVSVDSQQPYSASQLPTDLPVNNAATTSSSAADVQQPVVLLNLERARKILTLPPKLHVSVVNNQVCSNETPPKSTNGRLSQHGLASSSDWVLVPLDRPDNRCVTCDETFLSSAGLAGHIQRAHMSFCMQCNQCFVSTQLRDEHKVACTETKTAAYLKCAMCLQMFCLIKQFFDHQIAAHFDSLRYDAATGRLVPASKKRKAISNSTDTGTETVTLAGSTSSACDHSPDLLSSVEDEAMPDLKLSNTEFENTSTDNATGTSNFLLRQLLSANENQTRLRQTPGFKAGSSSSSNTLSLPETAQLNMTWQNLQDVRLDSTIDEVVSSICNVSAANNDFNSLSLNGFNIAPQSVDNSRSVSSAAASSGFDCDEVDAECAIVDEVVLSSEIQRQVTLEAINKRNAERAAHQCDMCKKKFLTSVALKDHMFTHVYDAGVTCEEALPIPVNTTVFVCRICSTAYSSREQFNKHTSRHSTFFSCSECSAITFNRDQMTKHIAAHKNMAFACALCLKAMRSEFSLHTHLALVHSFLLIWMCKPCCFGHQDLQAVVQHIQTGHSDLLSAQQTMDPVKVVTQYIAVCTHRKLHYQPSPTEQYVLPLSLPLSHRIPVGECAHRSFQSAQETVIACKQCGTLIPIRTYILEDAELRQQGNVQLQLVDERLEQTFPIAIIASTSPVSTTTNTFTTAVNTATVAAQNTRPNIILGNHHVAQTIPVSNTWQPDGMTQRCAAPCTVTAAQLNLQPHAVSQRSSITAISNLAQLSSTGFPSNVILLPSAPFCKPSFSVSGNSMAHLQNFGVRFPFKPQLPLLLPSPRLLIPVNNQQPLQPMAAISIGALQPQTTPLEQMKSMSSQVVASVSDTAKTTVALVAPSVADETSVDDILDSVVNKYSVRKQPAVINVALQISAAEKVLGNGNSAYPCTVCKEVLASAASLRVHSLRHFPEEIFFCLECGSGFPQSFGLTEHMSSNHRSKLNNLMDLRCCKCGGKSASVSKFLSHQYIHTELERCPCCPLRFYSNEALHRHIAKHSVGKFCCVFCGNCFKTQTETDEHCTNEHFLEYWFMCRECGLCYKTREQLKNHFEVQHADSSGSGKCLICKDNFYSYILLFQHFEIRHQVKSVKLKRAIRFDDAHDKFVGFSSTPQPIQSQGNVDASIHTEATTKADTLPAEIAKADVEHTAENARLS